MPKSLFNVNPPLPQDETSFVKRPCIASKCALCCSLTHSLKKIKALGLRLSSHIKSSGMTFIPTLINSSTAKRKNKQPRNVQSALNKSKSYLTYNSHSIASDSCLRSNLKVHK